MTCLRKDGHPGHCNVVYDEDLGPALEVRRVLAERGMTQVALADAVGITPKHVSQMLTGLVGINWPMMQRLAAALDCEAVLTLRPLIAPARVQSGGE